MNFFVGTSGWYYDWNADKTLDWYINNAGLNAIELNASFYRFPFPNQIKSWAKKGGNLKWIIKVNRYVTHLQRFNENALLKFKNFVKLFEPLKGFIDFYLFQLPPSFKPDKSVILEKFMKKIGKYKNVKNKICIEYRNAEWFTDKWVSWTEDLNCIFVSVDSPMFAPFIVKTGNTVYLRMHGRHDWYAYDYSENELKEILDKITKLNPEKIYILFNNDSMLPNAKSMMKLVK
ncbi:MAG TPA: DUF72 domain-containing protein [Candidatus Goldiibacteriota bacterium]|nr:DUF72 domain-containing protein [Candidatus Goldiibacteriota bacterium]